MISELETAGDVTLKKSNWRQAYRMKKPCGDIRVLAEAMAERFKKREVTDLKRLEQVLSLCSSRSCLTGSLLKHFGEVMNHGCGHCDRCRGIPPKKLKRAKTRKVASSDLERIRALFDSEHSSLGTPRQLARFLCGMSSPASMRARLYRLDENGTLSDLPFEEVEVIAESFF